MKGHCNDSQQIRKHRAECHGKSKSTTVAKITWMRKRARAAEFTTRIELGIGFGFISKIITHLKVGSAFFNQQGACC